MKHKKYLTIIAGFFSILPFILWVQPFYSGFISLFFLFISYSHQISRKRLFAYLVFISTIILTLLNISYQFYWYELITPLVLPIAFFITDFRDLKTEFFFKGVNIGFVILSISLCYDAISKNVFNDIVSSFVTDRNWGDENPFFGNGTALILTLYSFYFLTKKDYLKAVLVNSVAILTTSRIPLMFFVFIFIYILFDKRISKWYKYFATLILLVIIVYLYHYISSDEVLYSRLIKSGDREFIFNYSYPLFLDNIYTGFGPLKIPVYRHLHNSIFEVLFRYGVFTFTSYLFVLFLDNFHFQKNILFLFLIVFTFSFTQINLHNINYIVLMSVLIKYLKDDSFNNKII